ncbi:hypothetical protein U9M48_038972 [Paspalum notatum var. saurae]|uniref:Uncharacterized protein n=1 Tax=Paspalum notatum var. saurae TaxID=547442 RepID=A0AAQ3UMY0_PASNO
MQNGKEVLVGIESKHSSSIDRMCYCKIDSNKIEVIGLLWAWWGARNKVNAGEQLRSVGEIIHKVRRVCLQAVDGRTATVGSATVCNQEWKPPPIDVLKINIDGAFFCKE